MKVFLKKHQTDKKTLDIGAAEGGYAEFFPNRVGVDIEKKSGVDVVGDAHELPFEDSSFDVVLSTEVLEHLHTPEIAVREMYRVLSPGGRVVLTTRFLYPLHDTPNDYFRFTKYGLRHLFREFEDVEIEEETDSFGTFAVLLQTFANNSKLRGGVITRAGILFCAQIVRRLGWLIKDEHVGGRNEEKRSERPLLSSGYYLTCKKPQ